MRITEIEPVVIHVNQRGDWVFLVAPHNPSGPVASVASGHLCATLRNFYILEDAWGEVNWRAQLLQPAEQIVDGHLLVSDAPSLGHRLDQAMVNRHRRQQASAADSSKVQFPNP